MNIILKKEGNKEEVLNIEATHNEGRYSVILKKEIIEYKNGYFTKTFAPFSQGNFRIFLFEGRKSQKKINKINFFIDLKKDEILNLWNNNNIKKIVKLFNEVVF